MSVPSDRRYSKTHEWFMVDGDVVTVGITQFAVDELTDITYVEMLKSGTELRAGDSFGEVESVKATSELFSAVAGTIVDTNAALTDNPELLNDDPFDSGWIVKIKSDSLGPLDSLLDADEYDKSTA